MCCFFHILFCVRSGLFRKVLVHGDIPGRGSEHPGLDGKLSGNVPLFAAPSATAAAAAAAHAGGCRSGEGTACFLRQASRTKWSHLKTTLWRHLVASCYQRSVLKGGWGALFWQLCCHFAVSRCQGIWLKRVKALHWGLELCLWKESILLNCFSVWRVYPVGFWLDTKDVADMPVFCH